MKNFTDQEIYVIKRSLIHASFKFHMEDEYPKCLHAVHNKLLNEFSAEDKKRAENDQNN